MEKIHKTYKWIPKSRNDEIPPNSIYAGTTPTDGHVYVSRFNNIPGKVNLSNNKIHNFWVQPTGSRTCGEVLVTTNSYKWLDIKRGDRIPDNAVYSGLDQAGDKVWVGRTLGGEPGKLNCHDNNSPEPLMHNFWYNKFSCSITAHILVIEENDKVNIDKNETSQEKNQEIKIKNEKLVYYHSRKVSNELPLYNHILVNKLSKTIKSKDLEVSVGNMAQVLFKILSSLEGNIISLSNLITKFNVHLTTCTDEESITNKEFVMSPNKSGNNRYIFLDFRKENKIKKRKIAGIFNYNKTYIKIKINYSILDPGNKPALTVCKEKSYEYTKSLINSITN